MRSHPQPVPPLGAGADAPATARRYAGPGRGLKGLMAEGAAGDFVLANGRVVAGVRGIGGGRLAGALIDAGTRDAREDTLGALQPLLGGRLGPRRVPRRVVFTRLITEHRAGDAALRLIGRDPRHPGLRVEHRYSLDVGGRALRIETRLTNRSRAPITGCQIWDRADWGTAQVFAPGTDRAARSGARPEPIATRWLGAWSRPASYLYLAGRREPLAARFASPHRTLIAPAGPVALAPGASVSVTRALVIGGAGGLGALLPARLGGAGLARVTVTVRSETREPLGGARVTVIDADGAETLEALTRDDGATELRLAPGRYELRAVAAGRRTQPRQLTLRQGAPQRVVLQTGPPSQLVFELRERGSNGAAPGRLLITGIGDTPSPPLGPAHRLVGGGALVTADGKGLLPLPPGRYRVVATRGPEYELDSQEVELAPFRGGSVVARPARAFRVTGHVAVDLLQRTTRDPTCPVPPANRQASSRAEGVAAVAVTAAPASTSASKTGPRRLLRRELIAADGRLLEVIAATASALPRVDPRGQLPRLRQLAGDDRLVVASAASLAKGASLAKEAAGIDAVRLFSAGDNGKETEAALARWLGGLAAGARVVAIAGSAGDGLAAAPAGYPRTYVAASDAATAQELIAGIKRGAAVISHGAFIELQVGGKRPGERLRLGRRRRPVTVELKVLAASWVKLENLTLYVDGKPWGEPLPIAATASAGGVRLQRTLKIPLAPGSSIVAVVRGKPLAPVLSSPTPALAVTNPVWIER